MSWDKYLLMYINISGLVSSLVRVLRGVLVKKMLLKEAGKKKRNREADSKRLALRWLNN